MGKGDHPGYTSRFSGGHPKIATFAAASDTARPKTTTCTLQRSQAMFRHDSPRWSATTTVPVAPLHFDAINTGDARIKAKYQARSNGWIDRSRTCDIFVNSEALYRLSYDPRILPMVVTNGLVEIPDGVKTQDLVG